MIFVHVTANRILVYGSEVSLTSLSVCRSPTIVAFCCFELSFA